MNVRPMTGLAQTVLGAVPAGELGIALPHEHLLFDRRFLYVEPEEASGRGRARKPIGLSNHYDLLYEGLAHLENLRLLEEEVAVEEALLYQREGGRTLVDATNLGVGRDPLGLQRIARATGLHVIMGSGYTVARSHPPDIDTLSEDTITRVIVRDIVSGVGETGVRAGLIGEIGCSWPWTDNERKSLRAAAEAARETGAPLLVHPGSHPAGPQPHLDEIRATRLDLRRVIVGQAERWVADLDRLKAIAETGCWLAFDRFGQEVSHDPAHDLEVPSDADRMRGILWLIEHGHAQQVLLSHDVDSRVRLTRYGGHGLAHLLKRIGPRLRRKGLGEKDLWMLIAENPARALAFT
jgi:phosphotriesterase-related protein